MRGEESTNSDERSRGEKRVIRVGIIGCGWVGQRHYQSVVTASNAEISAIADIDEDGLNKYSQIHIIIRGEGEELVGCLEV